MNRIPQLLFNDGLVVPGGHQCLLAVMVFASLRQVVLCKGFFLYKKLHTHMF